MAASGKKEMSALSPERDSPDTHPTANTSTEMSFEERLQLQRRGRKAFSHAQHLPPVERAQPSSKGPLEVSSKKHVPLLRKVLPAKMMVSRDPRFDDLSGEYNADVFHKTYSFLRDIRKRERQVVEKTLRKTRQPEKKEMLEQLLLSMDQKEAAEKKMQEQRERELQYKREVRERARQGHKPFYLKKGDRKKLDLAEKYRDLKRRGKLEQFMSKKRKRNSNKDRRRLPNQ